MRRKLYKSRRGQISTEIMYAVGVMIMIFLLLTGVTFNRRGELKKMDDYLQKRNECLKVSNTIASLSASGFNTRAIISVYNKVWVYGNGRIVIDPSQTGTKETPCSFAGKIHLPSTSSNPYVELTGGHKHCFFNINEEINMYDDTDICYNLCILTIDDPAPLIKTLGCVR